MPLCNSTIASTLSGALHSVIINKIIIDENVIDSNEIILCAVIKKTTIFVTPEKQKYGTIKNDVKRYTEGIRKKHHY